MPMRWRPASPGREPLVAQTLTLSSFVPDQQQQKLALISDNANSPLESDHEKT